MYLFVQADAEGQAYLRLETPGGRLLAERAWACERGLSETVLAEITALLDGRAKRLADLRGLGVFAGPAGFTDLRITHAVANALAYGLRIPVVNSGGADWLDVCRRRLAGGEDCRIVKPDYGRPPRITRRKK